MLWGKQKQIDDLENTVEKLENEINLIHNSHREFRSRTTMQFDRFEHWIDDLNDNIKKIEKSVIPSTDHLLKQLIANRNDIDKQIADLQQSLSPKLTPRDWVKMASNETSTISRESDTDVSTIATTQMAISMMAAAIDDTPSRSSSSCDSYSSSSDSYSSSSDSSSSSCD